MFAWSRSGSTQASWQGSYLSFVICWVCSISGALGWAATLDILLLFYPVPRSIFLHWLMGTNFPTLIKYHRCVPLGSVLLRGPAMNRVFCARASEIL